MTLDSSSLARELERRAGADWELYEKSAESLELGATFGERETFSRVEEGLAARWWEEGVPRFACGSSPENLEKALDEASRVPAAPEAAPAWPAGTTSAREFPGSLEAPPDLFEELTGLVSSRSRGQALVRRFTIRCGRSSERIVNGKGLDISFSTQLLDGFAVAVGRKGSRACETRVLFRWENGQDLEALSQRLADGATLPLSDRPTPIDRGEWLLDPCVSASLLAGLAPLFCAEALPKWVHRGEFFSPGVTIVDDASADALYDGEGTRTRRVVVVERGAFASRLHDLASARRAESAPTGHGVRPSYRTPPAAGPRRLFFENDTPVAPLELLASVRRGLFAAALTAPVRLDFERDRYEVEFTGIALLAGRAQGPVAGARASGRISQLLRRIRGLSTDRRFFPMPYPAGAPTLLVERADFD